MGEVDAWYWWCSCAPSTFLSVNRLAGLWHVTRCSSHERRQLIDFRFDSYVCQHSNFRMCLKDRYQTLYTHVFLPYL